MKLWPQLSLPLRDPRREPICAHCQKRRIQRRPYRGALWCLACIRKAMAGKDLVVAEGDSADA